MEDSIVRQEGLRGVPLDVDVSDVSQMVVSYSSHGHTEICGFLSVTQGQLSHMIVRAVRSGRFRWVFSTRDGQVVAISPWIHAVEGREYQGIANHGSKVGVNCD